MEYFAKMIYEQWQKANLERDLYFKKGEELSKEIEEILAPKLADKIYCTFCDSCMEVEEMAFIEGFAYACKCLSNGNITLGTGIQS